MRLSKSEEDYLKALFHLIMENEEEKAGTNQLAEFLGLSPASVNAMLKKLRAKKLVSYKKYGKLEMTQRGEALAVQLIRKHRIWETFLYKHMNFTWDEVHEVAEQLEHIQSQKLIEEMDAFLGYPKTDPHGAVIPNKKGEYTVPPKLTLADMSAGKRCLLVSVKDSSIGFLQYVNKIGLELANEILVLERQKFDGSLNISFNDQTVTVSKKFAENVYVVEI